DRSCSAVDVADLSLHDALPIWGHGQYFITGVSDEHCMFPLRRKAAIACDHRPAICKRADIPAACVNHGLNGEDHSWLQTDTCSRLAIVKDLGVLMELAAHAMPAVFANYGKASLLGMLLDGMTHIPQGGACPYLLDPQPHALIGRFYKSACKNGGLADAEHAAGVSIPTTFNY